ncbi:hypothetical protein HOP50_07g46890 [Chloropicon primus]|nr:hypothetical protein A3770_07p46670 [Chloropicon primus]UPR01367.1 hypothetical protein HOP50_07g46890 [Chloropicon primus]|eukprot:QDZ22149.1 hypothetical protein A3770_07p46670 [Chloropicon primus]
MNASDDSMMMTANSQRYQQQQQQHFNSIWRESSQNTTYNTENSIQTKHRFVGQVESNTMVARQPLYRRSQGYVGFESPVNRDESKESQYPTSQRGKLGKKSFADLFQSIPSSELERGSAMHGGEDVARSHYYARRYHNEMRGFDKGASPRVGGGAQAPASQSDSTQERYELMLQEMNSRIQMVTKMILNVNSNVNTQFQEMKKNLEVSFEGVKLAMDQAAEEAQGDPNLAAAAVDKEMNSLWSREPSSYCAEVKSEAKQEEKGEENENANEKQATPQDTDEMTIENDTLSITSEDAIEEDSSAEDDSTRDESTRINNYIKKRVSLFFQSKDPSK